MRMAETTESFEISAEQARALGAQLAQAFNPRRAEPGVLAAPEPVEWELANGGTAWVWRAPDNETLTKPVIIADGFSGGASKLEEWAGLWAEADIADIHPWGTQLHQQGRDVIVLGYDSRSAPIAENAEVAIECIQKANEERSGDTPLVVGGLSMGGLVTRYALAKMEKDEQDNGGPDHETGVYFSYDSPHRGAWIPISLQVFAHFLKALGDQIGEPDLGDLSKLINSPAARELLWKHTATHTGLGNAGKPFPADQARTDFLAALEALGSFPTKPQKLLGVANGRGDGKGLVGESGDPLEPGVKNLDWPITPGTTNPFKPASPGATLYTQAAGENQVVAELHRAANFGTITVKTSGIPALDGAPGGTLDSFKLAADALQANGFDATVLYPDVCFVPVASAVDLADPSDPFAPIGPDGASGLHAFKVASQNEGHTLLTQELCDWLTERF
ncbi:MAG: hypothetical protein QOI48_3298 [Solirubrobacteraceae bacterium]|nr:hypothetical protein [Solirubrobacteraceae bacterium]